MYVDVENTIFTDNGNENIISSICQSTWRSFRLQIGMQEKVVLLLLFLDLTINTIYYDKSRRVKKSLRISKFDIIINIYLIRLSIKNRS